MSRHILIRLIEEQTVESVLKRRSHAQEAIRALQTLLHELGFERELNWQQHGADGDYGHSTAEAVRVLATRNGLAGDGELVTAVIADALIKRYDSLDEMRQLYEQVRDNTVEQSCYRGSTDTIAVAALQTLLHDAGFAAELNWHTHGADGDYSGATVRAVRAFAAQQGIPSDGTRVSRLMAQRLLTRLEPFYGSGWAAIEGETESTTGSEPGTGAQTLRIRTVISGTKTHVAVSDGTTEKVFGKFKLGLYTAGNQRPLDFINSHTASLRTLGLTQSAINVMVSVAENEGNLDAINTWDNAFLSFGMFQWTAGPGNGKGELPALVHKVKKTALEDYETYYGRHGLDVIDTSETSGYFTLNGRRLETPSAKEQLRTPAWAFYFWLSGQSATVQAVEIEHALSRLRTFYTTDRYRVGSAYVSDLITSEYGVALILDHHVNRPAYVKDCLEAALSQTGLRDPHTWGTAEERRLIAAYLTIRQTYGTSPMTDAAKRASVTKKYLDNGTISDERGSFAHPFS